MTGLGERSHLLTREVDLDTHVTDIANVVRWESLEQVCLVAHSYAGWPCGAALDAIGDKVASVVWLDAFIPQDGRRLADLLAPFSRAAIDSEAANGEISMPMSARLSPSSINPRDEAFVRAKLTPQPLATYAQPLRYAGGLAKVGRKTYVRLPAFPNPAFDAAFAACKVDASWTTTTLAEAGFRHVRRARTARTTAATRGVRPAAPPRRLRAALPPALRRVRDGRGSPQRRGRRHRRRSPWRWRDAREPRRA